MTGDGKTAMNYEQYILPHLLPEVRPRTRRADGVPETPDEAFFIRTHQALEIWFAQILSELEYARLLLSQPAPWYVPESDVPDLVKHVRRAAAIFDLVRQHLPVLETLDTTSFYHFRKHLFGASGTQSYRFREVEWLMGLLDSDLLDYTGEKVALDARPAGRGRGAAAGPREPGPNEREHASLGAYQAQWQGRWDAARGRIDPAPFENMPAAREALERRMADIAANGSLRRQAVRWLARTTFPAIRGARPHARHSAAFARRFEDAYMAAYADDSRLLRGLQGMAAADIRRLDRDARRRIALFFEQPHRRAIVFLLQYAREPLLTWPASFVEALLELEQAFANWRDRHVAMVMRVLGGGRISTLGAASSGLPYLRGTLPKRFLPEISDARSFMLSAEEAAGIYDPRQLGSYGFRFEKRKPGGKG